MAGPAALYAFLPWMRRGVSAALGPAASAGARLSMPVDVTFAGGNSATAHLELFGPADVVGVDRRAIARTWPRANVLDAEPNLFPLVEFDQADFPWRYSPELAPADGRLQPWIGLVVLKDSEVAGRIPASATRPLPIVQVSDAPLPRLDQAWAWAHAQVAGIDTVTPAQAAALLASEPYRLTARLMCPRRLEAGTAYTGFLVPTFELGRRAGLGLQPDPAADPLAPAWAPDARAIELPVYYEWRFATGATGDFESLVRRLKPAVLPETVGRRPLDVSDPGAGLPAAASVPLGLEGALRAPTMISTPWPPAEHDPFVQALRAFVNRPADLLADGAGVRAITAPLYGRWYAAADRLTPGSPPAWFQEVNSDPRWRAAAGLGAQVVEANQRQLMASAWEQAGGLSQANLTLATSQFSRELSLRITERHLAGADDELVMQVSAPVQQRVLASPITIKARIAQSPISDGLLHAQWRRVSRPLGRIGKRQGRVLGAPQTVLGRVNRRELSPAPPPPTPDVLTTTSRAGAALVPAGSDPDGIRRFAGWLFYAALALLVLGVVNVAAGGPSVVTWLFAALAIVLFAAVRILRGRAGRAEIALALRNGTLTPDVIAAIPARAGFVATESTLVGGTGVAPSARGTTPAVLLAGVPPPGGATRDDSASGGLFRQATSAMVAGVIGDAAVATLPQAVTLTELRAKLLTALDPAVTIAKGVRERLQLVDGLVWDPLDPLEPVIAGPDFPQPMYRYLAELAQEYLLPGLPDVGANTVTLAETNQAFVEAYMLGLNHAMGSELLWREYPTDQRRTYFRQFWDPSGFLPPAGQTRDNAALEDILPIHRWAPTALLGANGARNAATGEQLVVLIRGDVVHRYPTLTCYAAHAVLDDSGARAPGDEEQQPVFSGSLAPDIAFFGFPLTESQVRGSASANGGDLGWFFILQEHASEPRFGLDVADAGAPPPATWNDLSWGELVSEADGLAAVDYIDLNADLPDTRGVTDPPGVAWHADGGLGPRGTDGAQIAYVTLQRPMRVAIHANDMLHS